MYFNHCILLFWSGIFIFIFYFEAPILPSHCTKYFFFSAIQDDMLLQEDLVQMVPMISETNAMAEELDKKVSYGDKKIDI